MVGSVDLYWLPLGAGGHSVRLNGVVFEALSALRAGRPRRDLYHSALEVRIGPDRYVIEMAPVWSADAAERGVIGEGPVGSRRLRRLRLFRYEIRCWHGGRIPDVAEAVDSPIRVAADVIGARTVLARVRAVPLAVWGRDDLATGEMWNSNSVVSFVLEASGLAVDALAPPPGGRAPGWDAGVAVARRLRARCVEPLPHRRVMREMLA